MGHNPILFSEGYDEFPNFSQLSDLSGFIPLSRSVTYYRAAI